MKLTAFTKIIVTLAITAWVFILPLEAVATILVLQLALLLYIKHDRMTMAAIGGLAVGESHEEMYHILDETVPYLPEDKPTYLMGVGTPANILEAVDRGVDFFDCVYPSRNGRHGHVYTAHGKLNLFNKKYELDARPIEKGCQCPACKSYSRAYIRHLLKAKEMLGMRLCVLHNLYFYNHLMEQIREAIENHSYQSFKKSTLEGFLTPED